MRSRLPATIAGLAALALAAPAAAATSITIPWNLDFTIVRSSGDTGVIGSGVHSGRIALQSFEADHTIQTRVNSKIEVPIVGTDIAGIDVTAGLTFNTEARNAYHITLPYEITLTAPDRAKAGTYATVKTDIRFTGDPTFSVNSLLSYGTDAFANGSAFVGPFDGSINVNATLPDFVPLGGGSSVTFGGTGSYSDTDTGGRDVSIGPFAHNTLSAGGLYIADGLDRMLGTQLQTEGRIDAQRGEVNLLDIIEKLPVVGAPAAIANTVLDLDLEAGVDLIDRSTLNTGALYALYTTDNFATTQTTPLNRLGSEGFAFYIPPTATGEFSMDFYGLGIGIGLLQEAFLVPELQLVLDALDPLGSWKLFDADLGDPWLIGRQTSKFQYEETFQFSSYGGYIPPALRTLTFNLGGVASAPPGNYTPTAPDAYGGGLAEGAPLGGSASLPGTAPTEGTAVQIQFASVPEPNVWLTLIVGFGLTGTVLRRRRLAVA